MKYKLLLMLYSPKLKRLVLLPGLKYDIATNLYIDMLTDVDRDIDY